MVRLSIPWLGTDGVAAMAGGVCHLVLIVNRSQTCFISLIWFLQVVYLNMCVLLIFVFDNSLENSTMINHKLHDVVLSEIQRKNDCFCLQHLGLV